MPMAERDRCECGHRWVEHVSTGCTDCPCTRTEPTPKHWTIYACTEPDCGYYRDSLSGGVHMVVNPDNPGGAMIRHTIEAVEVVATELAQWRLQEEPTND